MRRPDPDPRFTLIASSFGLGMALLDVTAGNVALPSIRASLHTDTAGLSWIVDGYTTSANYPYAQKVSLSDSTTDTTTGRGAIAQQANDKIKGQGYGITKDETLRAPAQRSLNFIAQAQKSTSNALEAL